MAEVKAQCPQPSAAVISTNPEFIIWLKLIRVRNYRKFQVLPIRIPDPLAECCPVREGQDVLINHPGKTHHFQSRSG